MRNAVSTSKAGKSAKRIAARPLATHLAFMRLLWTVSGGLRSLSAKHIRARGWSERQRLVLRVVGAAPGITCTELARLMVAHPSTILMMVQRLEARGQVVAVPHPNHQRSKRYFLTSTGRAVASDSSHGAESAVRRMLSTTRSADLAATERVLAALAQALLPRSDRR